MLERLQTFRDAFKNTTGKMTYHKRLAVIFITLTHKNEAPEEFDISNFINKIKSSKLQSDEYSDINPAFWCYCSSSSRKLANEKKYANGVVVIGFELGN